MDTNTSFIGLIPLNYDKYLGPFLFEPYALELVSRLQDKKYPVILEIACGTGRVTAHLAKSVECDSILATDLNQDMLDHAKKIITDDKVKWMQADALDLPYPDNFFDLIVCQFGIMFFPDKKKGIQEMYRVIKPGGKLLFDTWDRVDNNPVIDAGRKVIAGYFGNNPPEFYDIPFTMFNENELVSLMTDAGFKNVKITNVVKEGISESATDLAIGIVEGNPVLISLMERDIGSVDPIKKDIGDVLSENFGDHPLKGTLSAWICEAIK